MPTLPNPFDTGPAHHAAPVEAAASPILTGTDDAAADRFVLDVEAFMKKIAPEIEHDPSPLFLAAPSLPYIAATELPPVLSVLAKF